MVDVNTVPGGSVAPVAGTRLGVVLAIVGADRNTELVVEPPKTDPEAPPPPPPPKTDPPDPDPLTLVAGGAEPEQKDIF